MTTFEDRLLDELKQHMAVEPSTGPEPARPRRRLMTMPRLGVVLAGAATAAAVSLHGSGTFHAYAVESKADGTVQFTMADVVLSADEQRSLARELRAAGVKTQIETLPAGRVCQLTRGVEIRPSLLMTESSSADIVVPTADLAAGIEDRQGTVQEPGPKTEPEAMDGRLVAPEREPARVTLRRGDTVAIENVRNVGADGQNGSWFHFYRGKVDACEPVPAEALLPAD